MANEAHDPWALLAEARGSVLQHKERLLDCDHDAETCTCDLAAQKIALLARIDAALARHEATRWRPWNWQGEYSEVMETVSLTLTVTPVGNFRYRWTVVRYSASADTRNGLAASMTEAKEAAKKAAREMGERVSWSGTTSHFDAYTPIGKLVVECDHSEGIWRWKATPDVIAPTGTATTKEEAQAAAIAALEDAHGKR